jgi:TolB-like protein
MLGFVAQLFATTAQRPAGAFAWRSGYAPRCMAASVDDKLANAPRLSIVVLPFENLSGDKDQDYFADGITEDLTTDLSHLDGSFVIARNTAFTYKGKPVDAKQIGRELGVGYLLEGSVRRVGETITINAQLISTETGAHVWAERFEGERSKLGELQVEAVSRLARSLGVELVKAEALRAMRERRNNPDAVDLVMRGWAIVNGVESKAADNEAVALFERALSLDANNVQALIGLSAVFQDRATDFAMTMPRPTLRARKRRSTPPSPFSLTIRMLTRRKVWSTSPSINGVRRSRRRKRRSPTIATTRQHMRTLATIKCFSAGPRTVSRALKPLCV